MRRTHPSFSTISSAILALAATTVLVSACVSGTPTNATPDTGIEGLVNSGSGGATSGGGGGSNGTLVDSYKLRSVGGIGLPALLVDDSIVATDSTHIFRAWLDSSIISLNSDTTASETNYLSLFEDRTGAGLNSDSTFVNDSVHVADSASGTYTFNSTSRNVSLALTDTIDNQVLSSSLAFTVAGDSLLGYVEYTVFDLDGIPMPSNSSLFIYTVNGPSARDALKSPRIKALSRRQVITLRSAQP